MERRVSIHVQRNILIILLQGSMMVYYLGAGLVIIPDFTATSQQAHANVVPKGNTPTVVDSSVVHVQ